MPNHQQQPQEQAQGQRPAEGAQRLSEKAGQAAEQIKSSTLERAQRARKRAETSLDARRLDAAQRIRRLSDTLRSSSENVRKEDAWVGSALERASERLEYAADYVASTDVRSVAEDVERFARTRPVWFYGGALLMGLASARFLRSTSSGSSGGDLAREREAAWEPRVEKVEVRPNPSSEPEEPAAPGTRNPSRSS